VRCALANIGVHALIIIIIMAEDAPDQVRTVRHMSGVISYQIVLCSVANKGALQIKNTIFLF
jgi:hypothetical protein